ncbi:response regulator [Pseudosporangium ferrugineum]|uniref:response regulator n=1 Tax=Pseudosporangium ferrugineum TaxID=439699 RepID=UPI001B8096BE
MQRRRSSARAGFRMFVDPEPDIDVVGEAATGREAIEVARTQRADVVLMDLRMPEMDGLEATRRIGQDGNLGSRPAGGHRLPGRPGLTASAQRPVTARAGFRGPPPHGWRPPRPSWPPPGPGPRGPGSAGR